MWFIVGAVAACALLWVLTRRPPPQPSDLSHLVTKSDTAGVEPDDTPPLPEVDDPGAADTGELLFGADESAPRERNGREDEEQLLASVPGVHTAGGVTLELYGSAHGVLDVPDVVLPTVDPSPVSQSDTLP